MTCVAIAHVPLDPSLPPPKALKRPGEPLYADRVSPSVGQPMRRSPYENGSSGPSPVGDHPSRYPPAPGSAASMPPAAGPTSCKPLSVLGCVLYPDIPCADPAYPNSATSSWTPTTATFAENETPTPPQPQALQQTNSGASSNGSTGNSSSMQPSLMRTSQLTATSTNYNPYSGGNSKAKLELQSDLNLMAVGWYVSRPL
jgi:hypothetical protein